MQLKLPGVSFEDDSRGVSGVVGFVMIFAILMILLSINQAQFVPQENREVEFQHFQDVRNDMTEVHAAISEAGQADVAQYPTVTLGTTYPPRLFAVNPPPPSGTLTTTTKGYKIWINDTTDPDSESVQTRFLQYRNGYNEMDIGSIWYENSVLYLDERANGGGIAVYEDQEIIRPNSSVRLTALQEEFRESGTGEVTLNIYPAETTDVDLSQMSGDVSIEIPTRLSEDYWESEFNSIGSNEDWEYVDTTYVETTSDGEIYRLELTVNVSKLKFNTVGVDSTPPSLSSAKEGVGPGGGDQSEDFSESDPTIESATTAGASGNKYRVDYSVSDSNGDLSSIIFQLREADGSSLDTKNTPISGSSASGTSGNLNYGGNDNPDNILVTVTDSNGNTDTLEIDVGEDNDEEYPVWDAETIYRFGDRVSYEGEIWEANWWNRDYEPGSSEWGPWDQVSE